MSNDFSINIEGLDEVKKLLETLPNDITAKIQQDLAYKAGMIVKAELEAGAPDGNNDKKSINKVANNVVVKKNKTGAEIGFKKRAWYVKLIEKGTSVRKKESGASTGSMPKSPFVQKAHDSSAPKVIEFLQTNYLKLINAAIKKQLKRVTKKK